ncbi:MAG: LCP family protein, partial [Acidimicrobiales bacterium]
MFNTLMMAAALGAAGMLALAAQKAGSVARVPLDRSLTPTPTERGDRVVNILLVGSDSSDNLDPDDPVQIGRHGERLADVIILAHIDQRTGQAALLSLPRDLWLPIADTGRSDKINRAFVVAGPSGLIDTIEQRFDIPIHHYVNVDFAGFEGLVEAVGTVDVSFDAPARDWNVNADPPRSQTGFIVDTPGCHALGPREALAYVRSRYYQTQGDDGVWRTDPSSDLGRIERQQDFLQRLLQAAIDDGARNPVVLADLIDTGIENVVIDSELSPAVLLDLAQAYRGFEPDDLQTFTVPA